MKISRINHLDENSNKKDVPPLQDYVFTSRKHSMDYFTVDGVILRTGYKNKRDWYLLPIREMLDNDADFLWKNYRGADNASITVSITIDDELFRVTVRNSNDKNIPVFSNLEPIFDYDMRYGSKQDVHIISRGMLGDAMKQILSLGYVLLHTSDDGTAFTDKQWERPLIIRHNKKEWKIYLRVDKAEQVGRVRFEQSPEELAHTDTEIELVLPVIDEVRNTLDRKYIEQFCRKYSILTISGFLLTSKVRRGFYDSGIVQYPYAFEILAITFKNPIGPPVKSTEIIAAVNYSVSPKENTFEGDYFWYDKNGNPNWAKNIHGLLEKHGFHTYFGPTSRLPSIIVANLITPRRDPQGYDKSSIDTQPFTRTIATAINKVASGVQTYRAAGYRFQDADDYSTGRKHDINTKVNARDLLKQFLINERGLPGR